MRGFTIDWVTSHSLGLAVTAPVEIPAAKRVIDDIEVLGRAGTLTRLLGWEDTTIRVPVLIRGTDILARYQTLTNLLQAATRLTLSTQPGVDRRVKHAVVSPLIREGGSWGRCEITFTCLPFAYLVDNPKRTITAATTVVNPGSLPSAPVITVVGTGTLTFTINGRTFTVKSPAGQITLDSDLLISHVAGGVQADGLIGDFPLLQPGANLFTPGVGVTRLEVTGNWRNP